MHATGFLYDRLQTVRRRRKSVEANKIDFRVTDKLWSVKIPGKFGLQEPERFLANKVFLTENIFADWIDNQIYIDEAEEKQLYIKANPKAEDCKQIMMSTVMYRKQISSEDFCEVMEKIPRLFDTVGCVRLFYTCKGMCLSFNFLFSVM